MKMLTKALEKAAGTVAGLFVIALLIYYVGTDKLAYALGSFNLWLALPVFLIFCSVIALSALNLKILFDCMKKIGPKKFMGNFFYSWAVGSIVPGKIGDFSLAYLLRNEVPIGKSSAIIMLDKIITLSIISVLGSMSLLLFFPPEKSIFGIGILACVWVAGIAVLFTEPGRRMLKAAMPEKVKEIFTGFSATMNLFASMEKGRIFLNGCITALKIIMQSAAFVIIFSGFGVQAQIFDIVFITSAATILSFVPLTSGGLGIREGAFAFLSLQIGIPLDKSVSASVVSIVINYIIVAAIAAAFFGRKNGEVEVETK